MSRAFVNEDADGSGPRGPQRDFGLPDPGDACFNAAAARALLEAARDGDTAAAEEATGYRWGDPALAPHVRGILQEAKQSGDERLEQLATRFLI